MIYFVLIYAGIGLIVEHGFGGTTKDRGALNYFLGMIFWPIIMSDKENRDYVYMGWSGDPDKALREYLDAGE